MHIQLNDLLIRGCARHEQVQGAMRKIDLVSYTREELEKKITICEERLKTTKPIPGYNEWLIKTDKLSIARYKSWLDATTEDEIYIFNSCVVNDILPNWLRK